MKKCDKLLIFTVNSMSGDEGNPLEEKMDRVLTKTAKAFKAPIIETGGRSDDEIDTRDIGFSVKHLSNSKLQAFKKEGRQALKNIGYTGISIKINRE